MEANIVELAKSFRILNERNGHYSCVCPKCETESLNFPATRNIFFCAHCDDIKGRSAIEYLMKIENMTYSKALEYLDKQLITATEALKISTESSAMNNIMMEIRKEALKGGKIISYRILNNNNITLLQNLGYTVKEEQSRYRNHNYSISWNVSDK